MKDNIKDLLIELAIKKPEKVSEKNNNDLKGNVVKIIDGVILALGIVCVVVILIGGIQYMTSAGDTGKVEKGKKTIIYGLIGLIICALSYAIVNWVIGIM